MSVSREALQQSVSIWRIDRERVSDSLHDEIYRVMREALISGDFVPGEILPMRMLAERFGTSLIPVRDALKRLASERALATLPNRRFCVPRMTRAYFQELLQIRLSLEPMLANRAAAVMPESVIREMEAVNREMQDAVPQNDVRTYLNANQRFHFLLYRAAGGQATLPIIENLWLQVGPFLNGVFTSLGIEGARDNHTQILRALRRRDPAEAGRAIASDLADAADVVLARDDFLEPEGGDMRA